MFCKPFSTAAIAVVLSAAGWAYFQGTVPNTSKTVREHKACTFSVPANATVADRASFARNFAFGTNDPTTLSLVERKGEVNAVLTGLALSPSGERQLIVTVVDDIPDLLSCSVELNGQVGPLATRANGGVIDRNGQAIGTISLLIPKVPPIEIIVRWTSSLGEMHECQVNL
jgi:hypothetical protein